MKPVKVPASTKSNGSDLNTYAPSVGNISKTKGEPKTSGIKMRGAGAATKGVVSRGPMA
jgi:hypothetical protein